MIYEVTYVFSNNKKITKKERELPVRYGSVQLNKKWYLVNSVKLGDTKKEVVSIPYIYPTHYSNYVEDVQLVTANVE